MAAPLFDKNPFLILWELTRACDLACRHCRASAVAERNPFELSLKECLRVLDQIRDLGSPLVVLTGGDPLKRPDVFDIVRAGSSRGLRMTMTPSGTPLLTDEAVQKLAGEGLARLAVSLDGPDAASHDGFRRVPGSFGHTWRGIEAAHKYGLPLQINTSFCRANLNAFEEMAELIRKAGAVLWSVFFVVPVGRASFEDELSADEFERLFEKMADLAGRVPFDIKSTAAPHYRRYLLQRNGRPTGPAADSRSAAGMVGGEGWRALRGVNDGNGLLFISHTGEVYPSGFLPVSAGSVRKESLAAIYRESELFKKLRNPDLLEGKCGACPYKTICGGSRARAYAFSGNPLAEEPCCAYQPPGYESRSTSGDRAEKAYEPSHNDMVAGLK